MPLAALLTSLVLLLLAPAPLTSVFLLSSLLAPVPLLHSALLSLPAVPMLTSLLAALALRPHVLLPLLLAAFVLLSLAAARVPALGARLPRLAALGWPYVPLLLLALGVGAALARLLFLLYGLDAPAAERLWRALTLDLPALRPYAWLSPLLPLLAVNAAVLGLAARLGSRRVFQCVALGLLLFGAVVVAFPQSGEEAGPAGLVLRERVGRRLLGPALHAPGAQLDRASLIGLAVLLLALYRLLEAVNLRHTLPALQVGVFEEPGGKRRPELERLTGEYVLRSAPHVPPRLPGGSLVYWRELLQTPALERTGWVATAASFLVHVVVPPSGLRLSATVLVPPPAPAPPPRRRSFLLGRRPSTPPPAPRVGLRVQVTDLRSQRTVLAHTFWEASAEAAAEQAAYAAAEAALALSPDLPEWMRWSEADGTALREYWRGVAALDARGEDAEAALARAAGHFRAASQRSRGNGLARLQLAETCEARGDFVSALELYLELEERFPRMLLAQYRLTATCSAVGTWAPSVLAPTPEGCRALAQLCGTLQRRGLASAGQCARLGQEPLALERFLLALAHARLQRLHATVRWRVLGWSLSRTSDRRRLWRTVLGSPRRRRALQQALAAAQLCLDLRRVALEPEERGLQRAWRRDRFERREARLCEEAHRATRLEAGGWAVVHYNLACALSLRLAQLPPTGEGGEQRTRLVARATRHLTCALRDSHGPFASGRLWWLWSDPDLAPLRTEAGFQAWLRVISLGEPPPPAPRNGTGRTPPRPERRESPTRLGLGSVSA
ncbi:hypothetical protein FGE12_28825 [Aggregicoccus sp. 17bor-14]|uniref:hypothetical protein n=1 Tax=Myxococcaceae TaxID=31 RepID=UPI00129C7E5C|nr:MULTISPECIES: hypothetical protein [Myxococcaceae]MBF5046452.1 hypothetical protein [Simulacricoccus sp. 17bor-14]MRI92170.1 hypothetical protein [Aggregicoccus sp. 17bor-14]